MAAPTQMTAHTINALKGWPSPSAVDFEAKLSADVTVDPVRRGSVVSLNSSGEFVLGVGTGNVMPLFLLQDSNDPDVANEGGAPATDKGAFVPIVPTGVMSALAAAGAYELHSTEFTGSEATFTPNTHLTAATGNGATAGKLAVGTVYTDTICGVVSRGAVDNGFGVTGIAFWPLYIPPTP